MRREKISGTESMISHNPTQCASPAPYPLLRSKREKLTMGISWHTRAPQTSQGLAGKGPGNFRGEARLILAALSFLVWVARLWLNELRMISQTIVLAVALLPRTSW